MLLLNKKTWILIAVFFLSAINIQVYGNAVDSLRLQILLTKNDSNRAQLFNLIAEKFLKEKKFSKDSVCGYADSALNVAQKVSFKEEIARALYLKGRAIINNTDKANQYLLQSLSLYETLNDSANIADCHLQLGVISYTLQNYADAELHFVKSINTSSINSRTKTISHYLLALTLSETNKVMTAIRHFNIALKGYSLLDDSIGIIQCNTYTGKMYLNINEPQKALDQLLQTVEFGKNANVENSILQRTYAFLSTAYLQTKNVNKAIEYGLLAIESNNDALTKKEALGSLSTAYAATGNYQRAYFYSSQQKLLNDSLYNNNIFKNVYDLRSKYTYEKKIEQEKIEQEKILAKQEAANEKEKIRTRFVLVIALLFVVLLGVLYNRFRLKQKHNAKLSRTLKTLRETQQQLVQQEKLASLGFLTAGIAHEIKNPINFITNFSQSANELIEEFFQSKTEEEKSEIAYDIKKLLQKINEHGKRADSIVDNMLMSKRNSSHKKTIADVNHLLIENVELAYQTIKTKMPDFECEIEKNFTQKLPDVFVNKLSVGRVIVNLSNNAFYAMNEKFLQSIRHKKENYKPLLQVSTFMKDEKVCIRIKDNGTGIPTNIQQKIFDPFFTTKPSGEGTGLGLGICMEIVKVHGGTLTVSSEENNFTQFIISLPAYSEEN